MARPRSAADIDPSITSSRRHRFLRERAAARDGEDGVQAVFRSLRLATTGTSLPATFPFRAALITAGVLAVEEVVGAGLDELRSYGLGAQQAATLTLWLHRFSTMKNFAYGPRAGQYYDQDDITLLISALRSASGVSDTYEVGDRGTLRLDLDVSAVSGSGTVHCQIETRPLYGSGDWRVVDAFPVQSAAGSVRRTMAGCDRFVRVVYTITGTSVTFSLTGEAV